MRLIKTGEIEDSDWRLEVRKNQENLAFPFLSDFRTFRLSDFFISNLIP
jgi:hypothetical protein